MFNKIHKIDSGATPAPIKANAGPATVGIEWDDKSTIRTLVVTRVNQVGSTAAIRHYMIGFDTLSNLKLSTLVDTKPVLINSRDYTQTSGDSIGFQSKPSQTVTGTASVYGCQVSPRFQAAIAGGSLVGVQSAPVLKGDTGNLSGDVRGFEASIDLNNAGTNTRTITGTVSALYAYLQSGSAMTYTGGISVIHVAAEDTKKWTHLLKTATGVGFVNTTASVGAQIGQLLVSIAGTTRAIPYYATA